MSERQANDMPGSLDLTKLSPAPWFVNPRTGKICHGDPNDDRENYPIDEPDDYEFCCLARNAFDVMARRGWSVIRDEQGWYVIDVETGEADGEYALASYPDPFTALVKADEWAKAREALPAPPGGG